MSETAYMKRIQASAAHHGTILYRNNVGQWRDYRTGQVVRYGLAPGSADLIGWTPVVITPDHFGQTLAVFTSVECKGRGTSVQRAQRNWRDAVVRDGGIGLILREPEEWVQR